MIKPSEDRHVQIVLDAFDTLFNKRDYASAEGFWSPHYIQHSAHIPPGRDGLFGLVKILPATLRYENYIAAASGDFIFHGRFSGLGLPAAWVVADIVRMEDGVLAEHWDVVQDEATQQQSERSADVRKRRLTGGEGGIRTPDRLAPMPHFECGAIDHSATSPGAMTGGLPPSVGRSSRRGWRGRQGAGGEKIGPRRGRSVVIGRA
jgi:predicted SnoaL-like aldol condensation-catalyzing enzyme